MAEQINKLVIEIGGKDYEFAGGGGSVEPGVPIPEDTVNSAAIIDGNVEMEDLSDSVKSKIRKTYDEDDESLHMDYDISMSTAPTVPTQPIVVEEEEEP